MRASSSRPRSNIVPAGRAAFLDQACADNPVVRAEVTSLLAAHDTAADFIEAPAYEVAADLLADDRAGVAGRPHAGTLPRSATRSAAAAWASCISPTIPGCRGAWR